MKQLKATIISQLNRPAFKIYSLNQDHVHDMSQNQESSLSLLIRHKWLILRCLILMI